MIPKKDLSFKEERKELANHIWMELTKHINITDKKDVVAIINQGINKYLSINEEIIIDNN